MIAVIKSRLGQSNVSFGVVQPYSKRIQTQHMLKNGPKVFDMVT